MPKPAAISSCRLVVLSGGGLYAERILVSLALQGLAPEAVLIVLPAPPRTAAVFARLRRSGIRGALAAAGRRLAARLAPQPAPERWSRRWQGLAREIVEIDTPAIAATLRRLRPDWLVLADSGLVTGEVLALPARGTLNTHPALLPWVRGLGVVERSIERGVPVGVTVHLVDDGIDTGPILRRELTPVAEGDTLRSLRCKAEEMAVRGLVKVVRQAKQGESPASTPQTQRFPYCRRPDENELMAIEERVRVGEAKRLYEKWIARFPDGLLPTHFQEALES